MSAILKPIVLWTHTTTLTSDEACTSIYQYQLAPPPSSIPAPYQAAPTATSSLSYLPPLHYFCIKSLIEWPDQVHALGPAQLRYQPPLNRNDFDIIQALIPTYRPFSPDHDNFDMRLVDPRLWAVLPQIYEELPPTFRTYTLPLSDVHLPLLQRIPSTSHFSLITVLSLSKCRHLTDDTVVELRELHTLAALDASVTALGSWGLLRLAKTLSWSDGEDDQNEAPHRRGPWGLRVLYLNNCVNVDNKVLSCLSRFPLLSVVDLRGTMCKPWLERDLSFNASSDACLYDPANLTGVLAHLSSLTENSFTLFSNHTPYTLHVDSLYHKINATPHGRPATNSWDPYCEEEDRELGMQVSKGRMDVFLPPVAERYYRACPYEVEAEVAANGNPDEWYSEEGEDYDDTYREDSDSFEDRTGSESEGESVKESADEDVEGGEDQDEEEDEQRPGPQNRSDPQEPQPEVPRSWMDAAEGEMRIHQERVIADRFYGLSAPRRTSSMPSLAQVQAAARSTSTIANPRLKPPDRLMLFRTPPPWSSLPSRPPPPAQSRRSGMSTSVFAASSTARHPPPKRRQAEDATAAPTDQARKRLRTIASMQPIFSMVQKRFESAASGKGKAREETKEQISAPSSGPARRVNPFARKQVIAKMSLSAMLKRLQPSAPTPARPVERARPSSERKPRENPQPGPFTRPQMDPSLPVDQDRASRNSAGKRLAPAAQTTGAAPPRPAKKLKPITTLPVPEWPGKPMKPLSEHRNKLKSPLPKPQKQTTLPALREPVGSGAAKAKVVERRVSAPMRLELTSAKAEKGLKGNAGKHKSKGAERLVHKSSSGGKGFDWKGWSAG